MADLRVRLSGTLDAWSYRNFPESIGPGDLLHVDLNGVEFCRPDGLVAVGVLLEFATRQGAEITVTQPFNPSSRDYMTRMRFHKLLERLAIPHDLPPVNERHAENRFIELSDFEDESKVLKLAEIIHSRLEKVIGNDAAASVFLSITELGSNVAQHAGCDRGFFMAQQFIRANRFDFAIGDPGIGLRASLHRFSPGSHDNALRLALQRGISATRELGRGEGIADIKEKLQDAGGTLSLISGNALGHFHKNRSEGLITTSSGHFPGTLVVGSFPIQCNSV